MTQQTTTVYLVRAENSGEPESYVVGIYPTKAQALARVEEMENEDGQGFDYAWAHEIKVGPNGNDLFLGNR